MMYTHTHKYHYNTPIVVTKGWSVSSCMRSAGDTIIGLKERGDNPPRRDGRKSESWQQS